MNLPTEAEQQIRVAYHMGASLMNVSAIEPEPPGVALTVERHRWFWRPERISTLLIAESHVFTDATDLACRIDPGRLPLPANGAPTEYVRLVYCLGYGENAVLSGELPSGNTGGTWQFWDLFGRITGNGKQPRKSTPLDERLRWKVDTLLALQRYGVWLIDASANALYMPGGRRVDPKVAQGLHHAWYSNYGKHLIETASGACRCIIGQGVSNQLAQLGVRADITIHAADAHHKTGTPEPGWPELEAHMRRVTASADVGGALPCN